MTLHEAIEKVLKNNGSEMSAKEIAVEINKQKLYQRGDGNPVPSSQIHARVKNYMHLFKKNGSYIDLRLRHFGGVKAKAFKELDEFLFDIFGYFNKQLNESVKSLLLSLEWVLGLKLAKLSDELEIQIEINDIVNKLVEYNDKESKHKPLNYLIANRTFLSKELILLSLDSKIIFTRNSDQEFYEKLRIFLNEIIFNASFKVEPIYSTFLINKLLVELLKPQPGEKIYDPASGLNFTLIEAYKSSKGISIYGQELDELAFEFGKINLLINGVSDFKIENENSISNPIVEKEKVDVAICIPPFKSIESNDIDFDFERMSRSNDTATLMIEMLLSRLTDKGRIGVVLPEKFFFDNRNYDLRKYLIDNDLVEAVIELPEGILKYAHLGTNLLLINKNKKEYLKSKVYFLNGGELVNEDINFSSDLSHDSRIELIVKQIIDLYGGERNEDLLITSNVVEIKDIANDDYFFKAAKYTSGNILINRVAEEGEILLSLDDILQRSQTVYYNEDHEEVKVLNIKDYKSSQDELKVLINKLNKAKASNTPYRVLSSNALLVPRIGNEFKFNFFEYTGESIALNQFVALELKDEYRGKINHEWLCHKLNSNEYQIELAFASMSMGSTQKSLSVPSLLQIDIVIPPLTRQVLEVLDFRKEKASELKLTKFINEINLTTTSLELKNEIEKFAKVRLSNSESVLFKSKLEFEKFPFKIEEIENGIYIKRASEIDESEELDEEFQLVSYILLTGDNNQINGVITFDSEHEITFEQYSEINSYSNFLINTSAKFIRENTNKLLNDFSHTTKNILKDIDKLLKDFTNTKNKELVDYLKNSYLKDDELLQHYIENEGKKKEDYLAFNRLIKTKDIVKTHLEFFKRNHNYYKQNVNSNHENITLKTLIDNLSVNKYVKTNVDLNELILNVKVAPIELALTDLIDNAKKYSTDNGLKIEITDTNFYIELSLINDVKTCLSESNYEMLGKEDIKKDDGTYSTGMSNAFRTINEDNEIKKASFDYYKKNKVFKLKVKLKKY